MENKKTGYAHIDKPWMKFYDEKKVNVQDPKMNITDYLKEKTKEYNDLIATEYYGSKTTFQKFWEDVDNASRVLTALDYKKNDIIMNLVPNIPESGKLWLGAAQIGIVSDFIDPRPDSMDLVANARKVLELIKSEKANRIIALDKCYLGMLKPIEKELKNLGIEEIITLSATDSMDTKGKIDYLKDVIAYNSLKNKRDLRALERQSVTKQQIIDLKKKQLNAYQTILKKAKEMRQENKIYEEAVRKSPLKIVKYSELLKDVKDIDFKPIYEENLVNYIGHTSGTSGSKPKPIALTNENQISALEQLFKGNVNFNPGDRALNILPFFASFGANDNYLLNIASGTSNIIIPEFDIYEFGYLIKKYHPNVILATPAFLSSAVESDYLSKEDLKEITRVIYGGDGMTKKDEKKVDDWLRNRGSDAEVEKGYGMSENGGAASYAKGKYNYYESIGIPLPNTTFAIVDPDIDDKLVPIKNEEEGMLIGELAMSSDAITPGTLENEIIVPHYMLDGEDYIRTRDLVMMDRDGIFYHKGRKDRSFTRLEGYKIKPYVIEEEIQKSDLVQYCMVVPYYDEEKRGLLPIAHIVLDEKYKDYDKKEITEAIIKKQIISNSNMSSRQIPTKVKYRDSIPQTANNKGNFNALIAEGLDGSEISVNIEETNLAIESIEIIVPSEGIQRRIKNN